MEDSNHRSSSRRDGSDTKEKIRHRHRHEESDEEHLERDNGGERHRDRDRHHDSSSRRKEKETDRQREKEKHKDRSREKDKDRVRSRDRDGVKEKDADRDSEYKDRVRGRDRDGGKEKDQDRDSEERVEVDRERKKERNREEKEKEKEKEKEREKEKREQERDEKEREKERERKKREREREEKDREKERERKKREREREQEREREREKDRDRKKREREREERERHKEKEREREKRARDEERGRDREREKRRDDRSEDDDDVRDRDRKRRRRDDDKREKDREKSSRSKRHREDSEDSSPKKRNEDGLSEKKKETTREEDMEEEQRVLDEEMEKRRRRVQEWQELKRKKEEAEKEKLGVAEGIESGKKWTLEGESDDEEAEAEGVEKTDTDMNFEGDNKSEVVVERGMDLDSENGEAQPLVQNGASGDMEDDEIDPLDAFMNSMVLPEVEKLSNDAPHTAPTEIEIDSKRDETNNKKIGETVKKSLNKSMGRIIPGDSDSDYEEEIEGEDPLEDEDDEEFMKRVKKTKADKLVVVDHSKINYPSFRKNFYIEVKEISRMSAEEVSNYRKQLELKLHGKDIPKPIHTWPQIGLSTKILETIKKLNFEKPMPIQAQALPIIMSGRDCIGIAKTGSGKTLAFVLPMLRHIKDQPPLMSGDGPIGLIMAPTRELVQQIHSDIRKFIKPLGLTCVPVYGGSGVAQQIGELKRGAEIVVCTPGRMIDILCTSGGKITNLRRVTYLVMDEADRMFDMGFEPQITRIVQNTRPDRQTVLFSATFPRQVEMLARKVLNKPVEIQVGGRSVVNKDITQLVEVRPEEERFLRLLELLGEWYEKGKILIFVHTQDKCDALFKYLLSQGYPCLSLHGGKDQTDRESTISDFKSNVCNLLVATSIAARGLDVKELELVVNFDVPNHYEDYVHRVGRTGRAGRKGCAITFISPEDARYAPDLVKALQLSEQVVPDDLKALADGFMAKVNQGLEQAHGTGYGGSGFKFNEEEDEARKAVKKAQAKEYGFEEEKSDSEEENEGVRKAGGDLSQQALLAQAAALAAASKATSTPSLLPNGGLPVSLPGVIGPTSSVLPGSLLSITPGDGAARAAALAAAMNLQHSLAKIQADAMPEHYEAELEINDFPQNARWRVTHKETLGPISEWTGAAITTRGQHFPPGKIPGPGDRKLYLFIEGPTEQSVKRAKAELKRALENITQGSLPGGSGQSGKYSVL